MALTIINNDLNSLGTMKIQTLRVRFASVTTGAITLDLKSIRSIVFSDETTAGAGTVALSGSTATFSGITANDYVSIIAIGQ